MTAHINTKHKAAQARRLRTRRLHPGHPSGVNRANRRAQVASLRGLPMRDKKAAQEDTKELLKIQKAKRIAKKQDASHERAVARKEAKKGIKVSLTKRAARAIQTSLQNRAIRKARREAHARKVAKQEAKNI